MGDKSGYKLKLSNPPYELHLFGTLRLNSSGVPESRMLMSKYWIMFDTNV